MQNFTNLFLCGHIEHFLCFFVIFGKLGIFNTVVLRVFLDILVYVSAVYLSGTEGNPTLLRFMLDNFLEITISRFA